MWSRSAPRSFSKSATRASVAPLPLTTADLSSPSPRPAPARPSASRSSLRLRCRPATCCGGCKRRRPSTATKRCAMATACTWSRRVAARSTCTTSAASLSCAAMRCGAAETTSTQWLSRPRPCLCCCTGCAGLHPKSKSSSAAAICLPAGSPPSEIRPTASPTGGGSSSLSIRTAVGCSPRLCPLFPLRAGRRRRRRRASCGERRRRASSKGSLCTVGSPTLASRRRSGGYFGSESTRPSWPWSWPRAPSCGADLCRRTGCST
mmetsp:Transcript_20682/g.64679  ORF Transcript_20682/g.64679 Transcript_20682/m.64679 type:complete len:263 (+) Transcript_20682:220-1008(+)